MRRSIIHNILPFVFCLIPFAVMFLVISAVPARARIDYVSRITNVTEGGFIDWLIIGLGTLLFSSQMILSWQALQWRGRNFNESPDRWLTQLAQTAEWFPLLGLIGTVAAILQTFGSFAPGVKPAPEDIIRRYAPAITATGSGLFMALFNIMPTWVVAVGREVIRSLAGGEAQPTSEGQP